MPHKFKVILDTNVVVSGILTPGNCFDLLNRWKNGAFNVVVCPEILEEYYAVLSRDKFCLPPSLIKGILDEFRQNAIWTTKSTTLNIVRSDPQDNKFIEAAIDGHADYIVSGDKHLLEIGRYEKILIVTPEEFSKII